MIYKYKTFEEAQSHLTKLLPRDHMELLSRTRDIAQGLHGRTKARQGIFKFKTLEEANRHRAEQAPESRPGGAGE